MGFFLPVILLGMAQVADPAPAPTTPTPQAQIASLNESPSSHKQSQPFDDLQIQVPNQSDTCFTMRSYYFDRQDDLAPEYRGMTTCEPVRAVVPKRTLKQHTPRLVPVK